MNIIEKYSSAFNLIFYIPGVIESAMRVSKDLMDPETTRLSNQS